LPTTVERRFAGTAQLVWSSLTLDERALVQATLWLAGLRCYGRRQLGTWWAQEQSRAHLDRLASLS
jgi:hypothetical protein